MKLLKHFNLNKQERQEEDKVMKLETEEEKKIADEKAFPLPRTNNSETPDYYEYIKYLSSLGWRKSAVVLTEKKTRIVTLSKLKKEIEGVFIDIRCPAGQKMSFPGLRQFDINREHFTKYPNLYEYPYPTSIRCTNDENEELYWSRLVKVVKEKAYGDSIQVALEQYDDLHVKADSRYKRLEERYYFDQGIEVNGEEHMLFSTCPDIDITNIELSVKLDVWTS